MNSNGPDATQLLMQWREEGDEVQAQLTPLIEEELRALVSEYRQRSDDSGNSALVHEAYLRMVDDSQMTWVDRARFYGAGARVMRQILVDQLREHAVDMKVGSDVDLVALDGALSNFAEFYPRKSEVVELRFFGGLDQKQISEALQVSEKTILRDWNFAKLWLYRALSNAA